MILKSPQEEKAVRRMQKIYLDAERKIVAEITRKRTLGYVDYAEVAALERVQAILTQMQNETFEYAPIMVETIFHGQGEKNAEGYANARALTTTETAIVQTLVNNLLGEVLEVSQTAYQSAKDYLAVGRLEADELREAALESVASQQAAGYSWTMAQKQMTAELVGKGVTGFVDKAGRKWSLTDYCNMAVRTTAKQAAVASILARDDHDLWQIVRIGSTCPVCAVYEGRIYSKSGTNPYYPPLASAFGKIDPEGANNLENTYLNIHPSCLHSLIRYTTIGKSEKQIQKDKDFSSFEKNPITHDPRTKKQRKAYEDKMRNRQRLLNDTRQWRRYKAVLGKDCPGYEKFLEHKRAGDKIYKELESKYRSFSIKAAKNTAHIEAEESHKTRKAVLQYSRKHYEDGVLRQRVDSLGENLSNSRELFKRIKETLDHRDGTHFEDLSYIFTNSEESLINKNYSYFDGKMSKCKPTERMETLRKSAPERTVIGIHNHPESSVPSDADIYAAWERKYKYGLVIGHNGIMFKYTVDDDYNEDLSNLYLEILNKRLYSKDTDTANKVSQTLSDLAAAGVHLEIMR